jgi:membrane-bound lytic murein transglycosylase B
MRAVALAVLLSWAGSAHAAEVTLETPFAVGWFKETDGYRMLLEAIQAEDPNVPGVTLSAADLDAALARVEIGEAELRWVARFSSPLSQKRQRARVRSVRHVLLSKARLKRGAAFAQAHAELLARVSETYGVAVEDLLGMLNAESNFGTVQGSFTVANVFVSQVAYLEAGERAARARGDYGQAGALSPEENAPRIARRRRYGAENLSAILRYAKKFGQDPFSFKGSWAGAIGYTQFMPASLRWAKDGDGDGHVDLSTVPDAVASTAFYLVEHGYVRGDRRARRAAFQAYNPNSEYVSAIDDYAARFKARRGG